MSRKTVGMNPYTGEAGPSKKESEMKQRLRQSYERGKRDRLAECQEKLAAAEARKQRLLDDMSDIAQKAYDIEDMVETISVITSVATMTGKGPPSRTALDAALEQSHDRGRAIGHMEGMAEEREARLPCGHPRPCIIPDKSGGRCAWCESLEQARVEERELARPLFEAVKKAMDEEYELSERTCDILWEAWCAYGLAIRESECAS